MGEELTTSNKILVAAFELDKERETFTAEDLIVRAWAEFPESFGLNGYRDRFPDSNRVLSKLMGSVGLCSRGWLEQLTTKTYRLTAGGRKYAASLKAGAPAAAVERPAHAEKPSAEKRVATRAAAREAVARIDVGRPRAAGKAAAVPAEPPPPPPRVEPKPAPSARAVAKPAPAVAKPAPAVAKPAPAVVETPAPAPRPAPRASAFDGAATLGRLATSPAAQKFSRGAIVTFADACAFWSISSSVHPTHLASRLDEIESLLKLAESHIQATQSVVRVNDKLDVNLTAVVGLQGLHKMLKQKYRRELDAIRARHDD